MDGPASPLQSRFEIPRKVPVYCLWLAYKYNVLWPPPHSHRRFPPSPPHLLTPDTSPRGRVRPMSLGPEYQVSTCPVPVPTWGSFLSGSDTYDSDHGELTLYQPKHWWSRDWILTILLISKIQVLDLEQDFTSFYDWQ